MGKAPKYRSESADKILTAVMVADYLHCHLRTVYRLVKVGVIPHFKLGADWRFERASIDEWIKNGGATLRAAAAPRRSVPRAPRLRAS